jgi:hypothetical protein
MNLPEQDIKVFYKLQNGLLTYVNNELKINKPVSNYQDIDEIGLQNKVKIRNELYNQINITGNFIKENPFNFNKEELTIISSWTYFIKNRFLIIKFLKKFNVFLTQDGKNTLYGVLGLIDDLKEKFYSKIVLLETVLLPFNDKIIYDGFMNLYNIHFGSGFKRNIQDLYSEMKAKKGIITSLLERETKDEGVKEKKRELLKYYLRSKRNREIYWDEIWDLINSDEELSVLYHQELGKSYAKSYGKRLKKIGIKDAWFGILEGIIIGSGKTRSEVEINIKRIIPKNQINYVYYYKCRS